MHIRTSVAIKCVCVGGRGEVCANFILGVINTCENFEMLQLNIEFKTHASHGMNLNLTLSPPD